MIRLFIKYRYIFLVLVIGLTVFSLTRMHKLYFNTDFSQFFPENDPEYIFYKQVNSELQNNENILVVGIENTESIFNIDFLQETNAYTDSLRNISGIKKVSSLSDLSYPFNTVLGLASINYLKISDGTQLEPYKKRIFKDFQYTGHFINKEGTVLFIWIELEKELNNQQSELVLEKLENLKIYFSSLNMHVMGEKYLESSFKKILSKEISGFTIWFFLFLCLSLLLIFRRPLAVIFPIVVVFISLIIFLGVMAVLNRPLGIMANLFPVIILIVGISDVIHMSFKYNLERTNGGKVKKSIHYTLKEIGWTTFITSFTTAIGFFVLYVAPMKAMRDFGLEAGLGVLLAYLLTVFLVPTFFSLSKKKSTFSPNKYFERLTILIIKKIEFLQKFPKRVIGFYFFLIVIAIFGIFAINTNNLKLSNVPVNSNLYENYLFFENNFGGSRNFELLLLAKNNHKLNEPDILNMGLNIHKYLDSLDYISAVKSPVLYYKLFHKAYKPSLAKRTPIPIDVKSIAKYERQIKLLNTGNYLFNKEQSIYKFSGSMKDLGRQVISKKNDEIINRVNTLIDTSRVEIRISGLDFLVDRAHQERINNMLYGLLIAVIIVAITLGLIYKNLVLTILTLLLNFIPILITAGIMGFMNFELRGATSIIFTVGFVIAVDDTIHLLSKFQLERKKGKNIEQAISLALKESGKAILATSIILIGGFCVLMYSDFMEIFTLGILVSIMVIITLSVDFILAPILILTWFKKYL